MQGRAKKLEGVFTKDEWSGLDVFALMRALLSVHGMWPLDNSKISYVKNAVVAISLMIHLPFVCLTLNAYLGNFDKMRRIILHIIATIVTFPMQFLIRFHPRIRHAIEVMMLCANESNFQSKREKALYDAEMRRGLFMQKLIIFASSILLAVVIMKPTMKIPLAIKDPGNATKYITPMFPVFVAPLRHSNYMYFSFYMTQLVVWYTFVCRFVPCTLVLLVMVHVAGQCAVISHRIASIRPESENASKELGAIVDIHVTSKQLAQSVHNVFSTLVMIDVFTAAAALALTTHRVVSHGNTSAESESFPFFISYCTALLALLFAYNYIGQNILNATRSYRESIYMCDWYAMPSNVRSSIFICMLGAEKTMELRVGGFHSFSFAAFADLIKSTVGYVSALSALV